MPVTTAAPIKYDPQVRRFRYLDSGEFASREAVAYQTSKYIRQQQKELIGLADAIYANPTDLRLQKQAGEILKNIHIANGTVAAKGADKMYANDYLAIGNELASQYGLKRNFPEPYGLRFLMEDVATGKTSRGRLEERLEMYSLSGKTSYFAVEVNKKKIEGLNEAKRLLGTTDRHCRDCVAYAGLGWQAIEDTILPTQACRCYTRCRCILDYR